MLVISRHEANQFSVDHTNQGLTGGEAIEHVLTQRLFSNGLDEGLDNGQGDISLEHGKANFSQHLLGVGLGEASLALDCF